MKKIILKTNIKRDKNKMYFCGTSEDGYITIGEAKLERRKKNEQQRQA